MKAYKILKMGKLFAALFRGPGKIFGKLNCKSGMRMNKENRVFFHSLEDAVLEGYRPCKNCKPLSTEEFEEVRHLIPQFANVQEFYDWDKKK